MLRAPEELQQHPVKALPQLIDTTLPASAITLAVWSGQSPPAGRGWPPSYALVAYIVVVALSKQVWLAAT